MANEQLQIRWSVPVTAIGAFLAQTIVLIYIGTSWKDATDNRLTILEKTVDGMATHENRIVVVEQGVLHIRDDLAEIKGMLRQRQLGQADTPQKTQQAEQ